jgi:uncharacterized protein YndB with AHSA1/START domain
MTERVVRTVRVRCTIAHAFEVFTARIDLWWPRSHRRFDDSCLKLEPTAGGRFVECSARGDEVILGDVLACDPPHRIRYTWYPGAIQAPTCVDVAFAEEGSETIVTIVHSEAGALGDVWPERVRLFERGWDTVLPAFVAHAASATDDDEQRRT